MLYNELAEVIILFPEMSNLGWTHFTTNLLETFQEKCLGFVFWVRYAFWMSNTALDGLLIGYSENRSIEQYLLLVIEARVAVQLLQPPADNNNKLEAVEKLCLSGLTLTQISLAGNSETDCVARVFFLSHTENIAARGRVKFMDGFD